MFQYIIVCMKPLLILFLTILSLSFATTSHAWTGKVDGISDGDTIKVLQDGKQVKIRLYGVDTPETAQAASARELKILQRGL